MRTTAIGLICTCATCAGLGCAGRTGGDDVADTSASESESGPDTGTETETGGEAEAYWVYASPLHPRALAATSTGVLVGGAYVPDFGPRQADLIALSEAGVLDWTATWLDDELPAAVVAVAWEPGSVWVGFEGLPCGDGCVESQLSRLDGEGVEQWRLSPPIYGAVFDLEGVDGDVVVVATNTNPDSSRLLRLAPDGSEVWRWESPMNVPPPIIRDVALGDGVLWAIGSRLNMEDVDTPWLGSFDPETGSLTGTVFASLDAADGFGRTIELLGDGFVVTSPGHLTALEIDGVRTWQVNLPGGVCPIDVFEDQIMIGCEAELQLRDLQSTRIGHWTDLEPTTSSYYWQDVALGERAYAGIGSAWTHVEDDGKVYGLAID